MVAAFAALPLIGAPDSTTTVIVVPAAPSPAPTSWTTPATASTSTPSPGVTVSTTKSAPPHTVEYTVAKGDTLTKLATKYNTTRKKLKDLNNLATFKLTPAR